MHKICFTMSFISCHYMFRAHVLIIRRSKLHYTASGIIAPIGGRLVHGLKESSLNPCLYMFRAHVLISRRSKLHYAASGIITPIGGRLVHTYRWPSRARVERGLSQPVPLHVSSTCPHHQEVKIALHSIWYV